jgi:hypothetical protein
MAKDTGHETRLEDLTDAEVERIEGAVFCLGGPPQILSASQLMRASTCKPLEGTTKR